MLEKTQLFPLWTPSQQLSLRTHKRHFSEKNLLRTVVTSCRILFACCICLNILYLLLSFHLSMDGFFFFPRTRAHKHTNTPTLWPLVLAILQPFCSRCMSLTSSVLSNRMSSSDSVWIVVCVISGVPWESGDTFQLLLCSTSLCLSSNDSSNYFEVVKKIK